MGAPFLAGFARSGDLTGVARTPRPRLTTSKNADRCNQNRLGALPHDPQPESAAWKSGPLGPR